MATEPSDADELRELSQWFDAFTKSCRRLSRISAASRRELSEAYAANNKMFDRAHKLCGRYGFGGFPLSDSFKLNDIKYAKKALASAETRARLRESYEYNGDQIVRMVKNESREKYRKLARQAIVALRAVPKIFERALANLPWVSPIAGPLLQLAELATSVGLPAPVEWHGSPNSQVVMVIFFPSGNWFAISTHLEGNPDMIIIENVDQTILSLEQWCIEISGTSEELKSLDADSDLSQGVADGPWSMPDSPKQWAKQFNCSWDTLKKRFDEKVIRAKKLSAKSYRIHVEDLPKS